jgi:cyclophilin family peptidyl-prolyl cis-trans isomerase
MVFMLFKDVAPRTVDVFSGLSCAGFYNSNTIFHRVIAGFMNQGGDPLTNGTGGLVFHYDDEFKTNALFTGNGQLALANSGKDTDGSQFFVTVAPYRFGDFGYTILGQLVRGFNVLSNINNTAVDTNSRPLQDVIITRASLVPNTTDTVLTLTGTNLAGVSGTIAVVADDGAGGRTTNSFTAATVSDPNVETPFLYPVPALSNAVGPINKRLTNFVFGYEFPGVTNNWYVAYGDANTQANATNTTFYFVTNQLELVVVPNTNYVGPLSIFVAVSGSSSFSTYDQQTYTFGAGDTAISASGSNFVASVLATFTNQLLATFTNGIPNSAASNFTATINWGDNSVTGGVVQTNVLGRKEVRGAHTYTNAGNYPVLVSITSYLGANATVTSTAVVPPALTLSRAGTNSMLRWPAFAFDYQLQSNTNLSSSSSTNWVTLSNPVTLSGYDNLATNSSGGTNRFFRLKR